LLASFTLNDSSHEVPAYHNAPEKWCQDDFLAYGKGMTGLA
jgi:hypothetical protein